ncbi:MAG TPA: hypothetical protein PKO33_11215 [Pyrinomonadaceae bacterium]|nr:hypothetical protein [Pyrinomonadaceae bacterium]
MNPTLDTLVRELDESLIERYQNDSPLFERLDQVQHETGILHDDRPICPFLRPHFFPRSRYENVKAAAETLHGAFERLTEAALVDPELLSEFGLTEMEERMARIDPRHGGLCVSSRFDAFLDGDDFKFLEYNAETPAGIGDQYSFDKVFDLVPEVGKFLERNAHWRPNPYITLLETLDATYREFGGKRERPNIAIVDWEGVSTFSEFKILERHWLMNGYNTVIANPYELDYDGEHLRVGDFVVDIFYKRVIIHEFLERFDESHPLIRAYSDGKVLMANNFRVKIPHKKTSFAVLSEGRWAHLFTPDQLRAIDRHIPWTRRIRAAKTSYRGEEVDLLECVRQNRERFILKPHDDYGGHGIRFGWESSESEWETVIDQALDAIFVVQERVPVEKTSIPTYSGEHANLENLNIDFDPFLFRGKVHGGLVRLSSKSLVNVSQGGGETSLVVMENF